MAKFKKTRGKNRIPVLSRQSRHGMISLKHLANLFDFSSVESLKFAIAEIEDDCGYDLVPAVITGDDCYIDLNTGNMSNLTLLDKIYPARVFQKGNLFIFSANDGSIKVTIDKKSLVDRFGEQIIGEFV